MPNMLRRAAAWLGLVDDERYDDAPDAADDIVAEAPAVPDEAVDDGAPLAPVTVLPVRHEERSALSVRPAGTVSAVYPLVISAHSFDDAERIGGAYRSGVPVAMNLALLPSDQARRVLDFNSGMIFAMGGRLEKLGPKLFLLSPAGIEVGLEGRERVMAGLARAA